MNKKIIIMVILMITATFIPCTSYAATNAVWGQAADKIAPRWTGMNNYEFDLTIRSGKAVCYILTEAASSNVDKVGFSVKLQQYQNGSWKTIESWSKKVSLKNGNAKFKESATISKGFTYRFTGTIKTYKNGKLLDTCAITSTKETY